MRVVTCAYCGQEYPQGTPTHGAPSISALTTHIKVCSKHPMRSLEAINAELLAALESLIAMDDEFNACETTHENAYLCFYKGQYSAWEKARGVAAKAKEMQARGTVESG